MANKTLFSAKKTNTNEAGGFAHKLPPTLGLAQYACTGALGTTFYASAEAQLDMVLSLCHKVNPEFIAKTAVFARENGYMKDIPALLCVHLASIHRGDLLSKVWARVIDNGRMLRNFVQIMRSGVAGRRSFGSLPKRLIANWFNGRTAQEIFAQSTGNDPSFCDILRMAHPKPLDKTKNALYQWFLGKEYEWDDLPEIVQQYENFKTEKTREVPPVPFEMLTALKLGQSEWCQIAMRAGWHWTRMNLNTMQRQKVFEIPEMVEMVIKRLRDRESIMKSRAFPYQILAAFRNSAGQVVEPIRNALQDALEIATENVPALSGNGYVCVDVSGSMNSAATGGRGSATSWVRCVDVAGLVASSLLRKNQAEIIPFENVVRTHDINARDTILTNAEKLAKMVGGGTNCSAPLVMLNQRGAKGDWIFLVSDNQSWADSLGADCYGRRTDGQTRLQIEWDVFKARNPGAKLVCLDIQPYSTTQAQERSDILNIGGFSDSVFDIVSTFLSGDLLPEHWVGVINQVQL